tara:strand:- start:16 stop:261 length:246 start_codon:yes stop_codon:yes gene_type:complete
MPNKCTERNCNNEAAVKNQAGKVTLQDSGNEVDYEGWMQGICLDCITGIKEFEGEMSETPYSDYMPADDGFQGYNKPSDYI